MNEVGISSRQLLDRGLVVTRAFLAACRSLPAVEECGFSPASVAGMVCGNLLVSPAGVKLVDTMWRQHVAARPLPASRFRRPTVEAVSGCGARGVLPLGRNFRCAHLGMLVLGRVDSAAVAILAE